MPSLQSGRRDLRQHLEVETPEHVTLDYEIAGLGSRAAAALTISVPETVSPTLSPTALQAMLRKRRKDQAA